MRGTGERDWLSASAGGIAVLLLTMALVPVRDWMGNTNVALILLAAVVAVAAAGGRVAGVTAAVVAALAFNFFHTEPYLTLAIDSREDIITTVLLAVIGLVAGFFSILFRGRRRSARERHAELRRLSDLSGLVVGGADAERVVDEVGAALVDELGLRAARFETGATDASLPSLSRGGILGVDEISAGREGFLLPEGPVQLAVVADGTPLGHFVLEPAPGREVDPDQHLMAMLLADQAAAAIALARRNAG